MKKSLVLAIALTLGLEKNIKLHASCNYTKGAA